MVLLDFASYNFRIAGTEQVARWWALGYSTYHWGMWGQFVFTLALTEQWEQLKSWKVKLFVHLPGVLITLGYLYSLSQYLNILGGPNNWYLRQGGTAFSVFVDLCMTVWAVSLGIAMVVIALKFRKTTFDPIKKVQVLFHVVAIAATFLVEGAQTLEWAGMSTSPLFFLSSISTYSIIIAIAIIRYDFLAVNAATASESIIATMSDAVFLLSPEYEIKLVNERALTMLSTTRDRLIGRLIDSVITLDNRRVLSTYLSKHLSSDAVLTDIEGVLRKQKGEDTVTPISLSIANILSSQKNTRGIVCIVRDISERKLQEERIHSNLVSLQMADEQIRIEIAKLQSTFSSIGEGVLLVTDQGVVSMANPTAMQLLGRNADNLLGTQFSDVFTVTSEKGEGVRFHEQVKSALKRRKVLKLSLTDSVYISVNEKRIPISITTAPVIVGEKVVGSISIFENISKEMEIDKAKSEFVSLAAHQLRTPITAIMWNLDIVREDAEKTLSSENKELLNTIFSQAENMSGLVSQFLNVSRLELGKVAVNPELTDLGSLLSLVIDEQKMVAKEKHQSLTITVSKKIPQIKLDKVLVKVVMQNLLSNAVKYTPEKGGITVALKPVPQGVEFTVADTGMGIPIEQQRSIFNKLFRAENALESGLEGNGLGLYLVKSIVSMMNGTISFVSEVGKGTTFTVFIPEKGMKPKEGTRGLVEVV